MLPDHNFISLEEIIQISFYKLSLNLTAGGKDLLNSGLVFLTYYIVWPGCQPFEFSDSLVLIMLYIEIFNDAPRDAFGRHFHPNWLYFALKSSSNCPNVTMAWTVLPDHTFLMIYQKK